MRIPRNEVKRREAAIIAWFQKHPTTSIAKMNTALKAGDVTGQPELHKLSLVTGYKLRKLAVTEMLATPDSKEALRAATKALFADFLPTTLDEHAAFIDEA